jgi:hypothetical protein
VADRSASGIRGAGSPIGPALMPGAAIAGLCLVVAGVALLPVGAAGGAGSVDPGRGLLAIGLLAVSLVLLAAGVVRTRRQRT